MPQLKISFKEPESLHGSLFRVCVLGSLSLLLLNTRVQQWSQKGRGASWSVANYWEMIVSSQTPCQTPTNPYIRYLNNTSDEIQNASAHWLSNLDRHMKKADLEDMKRHNHNRFFPFDSLASCKEISCIGGRCGADEAKIICGLEELQDDTNCVAYSIGGNNQWEFELDIISRTKCNVHTFDCTGDVTRFHKPDHSRIHFHHICLSDRYAAPNLACDKSRGLCGAMMTLKEIQTMLNHSRIDFLKMDIEGYEWPVFESWYAMSLGEKWVLPMQIAAEIHYRTYAVFEDLFHIANVTPSNKADFRLPRDMVSLEEKMMRMGYIPIFNDLNAYCPHCTEVTWVRNAQC